MSAPPGNTQAPGREAQALERVIEDSSEFSVAVPKVSSVGAAAEINRLHSEICQAARTTIEKAIRIGELLTQTKNSLSHGEWLPWLVANVEFSRQTVDNYRRAYERREEIKLLNVGNLTDAYRLLAPPQAIETEGSEPQAPIDSEPDWIGKAIEICNQGLELLKAEPFNAEHMKRVDQLAETADRYLEHGMLNIVLAFKEPMNAEIEADPVQVLIRTKHVADIAEIIGKTKIQLRRTSDRKMHYRRT